MTDNKIKLSEVPRHLRDEFGVAITYRRLYTAVLDGIVPAERDDSGSRWLIDKADLPEIAKTLKIRIGLINHMAPSSS